MKKFKKIYGPFLLSLVLLFGLTISSGHHHQETLASSTNCAVCILVSTPTQLSSIDTCATSIALIEALLVSDSLDLTSHSVYRLSARSPPSA